MSDKQKFTIVQLVEVEGHSREDVEETIRDAPGGKDARTFVVAAPLEAVMLTMNQPLVAVEALARMARQGAMPPEDGLRIDNKWVDARRFVHRK